MNQQSILSDNAHMQCHMGLKSSNVGSHISSFLAKSAAFTKKYVALRAVTHAVFDNR
jgi:hypothetical protein